MGLFGKCRRDQDDDIDLDERSPRLGLKYRDLILMSEIAKRAADLSQPRHVLFYLYSDSREVGESIAAEARDRGFDAKVRDPIPESGESWSIVCETNTVLTPDFVRDSVDFFESLADRHRSEYDGWEAAA
jgi:hypothetical protein